MCLQGRVDLHETGDRAGIIELMVVNVNKTEILKKLNLFFNYKISEKFLLKI